MFGGYRYVRIRCGCVKYTTGSTFDQGVHVMQHYDPQLKLCKLNPRQKKYSTAAECPNSDTTWYDHFLRGYIIIIIIIHTCLLQHTDSTN